MKNIYRFIERVFERVVSAATAILGNSITFIIALLLVTYWMWNGQFSSRSIQDSLRDIIHGVIFLSLFIIQKSFNRHSAALHLKVDELVASNAEANNAVIKVEEKTEHEITELSKEIAEMVEQAKEASDEKP